MVRPTSGPGAVICAVLLCHLHPFPRTHVKKPKVVEAAPSVPTPEQERTANVLRVNERWIAPGLRSGAPPRGAVSPAERLEVEKFTVRQGHSVAASPASKDEKVVAAHRGRVVAPRRGNQFSCGRAALKFFPGRGGIERGRFRTTIRLVLANVRPSFRERSERPDVRQPRPIPPLSSEKEKASRVIVLRHGDGRVRRPRGGEKGSRDCTLRHRTARESHDLSALWFLLLGTRVYRHRRVLRKAWLETESSARLGRVVRRVSPPEDIASLSSRTTIELVRLAGPERPAPFARRTTPKERRHHFHPVDEPRRRTGVEGMAQDVHLPPPHAPQSPELGRGREQVELPHRPRWTRPARRDDEHVGVGVEDVLPR
mmetsp:Transcript_29861/g.88740  ORF Transcript_29861/g.88740 Transcript_29861/m.88740 type:complete len:370 (-) Transcript_29861:65-1174(-)